MASPSCSNKKFKEKKKFKEATTLKTRLKAKLHKSFRRTGAKGTLHSLEFILSQVQKHN